MTELERDNSVAARSGRTTIILLWSVLAVSLAGNVLVGLGVVNHPLLQPVFGAVAVAGTVLLIVRYRRRRKLR